MSPARTPEQTSREEEGKRTFINNGCWTTRLLISSRARTFNAGVKSEAKNIPAALHLLHPLNKVVRRLTDVEQLQKEDGCSEINPELLLAYIVQHRLSVGVRVELG